MESPQLAQLVDRGAFPNLSVGQRWALLLAPGDGGGEHTGQAKLSDRADLAQGACAAHTLPQLARRVAHRLDAAQLAQLAAAFPPAAPGADVGGLPGFLVGEPLAAADV